MAVAISPGAIILLLYLQNTIAQQCLNNVGLQNSPGFAQQNFQKSSCGFNKVVQNGLNLNPALQGNTQQLNYQQQPNIQQATVQQIRNQPSVNTQQGFMQQPVNAMSNSQLLKQPNQELAANIISALYNIKQSGQNERDTRNIVQGNPSQPINYEQLSQTLNLPNPLTTVLSTSKPQNNQFPIFNSDHSQNQPSFSFQFVPNENFPVQPNQQNENFPVQLNQQMFALPIHKISTKDQNQGFSIQNQPLSNSVTSQQTAMQSPMTITSGIQKTSAQSQPIILTFQPPQITSSVQNQPTLSTSQSEPIIYTVQTQPPIASSQNQQNLEVLSQKQATNYPLMGQQSLMSYVMSQMQNSPRNNNMLASILPTVLNSKPEKSSSMKTLLPLILNILNEKKGCCGCPHCGCNNNGYNNEQTKLEPLVNTGYSNQINYSAQKPVEDLPKNTDYVNKSVDISGNDTKQEKPKVVETTPNSPEISEEEEGFDSEEESDEEGS